jgi:hypothetical protein
VLDVLGDGEPLFDIWGTYPYIKEARTLKQLGIIKDYDKGCLKPYVYITAMLMVYRVIKALQN